MKIDKRRIVERLILTPKTAKRNFWAREMHLLNKLLENYPIEFVNTLSFKNKFDSMAIFLVSPMAQKVKYLYQEHTYKPKEYEQSPELVGEKYGSDRIIHKTPRTVREFLNE